MSAEEQPAYRCLECGHEWREKRVEPTDCPECGHLWLEWLNYEEVKHLSRQYKGRPYDPP